MGSLFVSYELSMGVSRLRMLFSQVDVGVFKCSTCLLQVRDGGFDGSPMLGKRYCGSSLPPVWTSSSNLMWVRYVTDGSSSNTQFKATYTRERPSKLTFSFTFCEFVPL